MDDNRPMNPTDVPFAGLKPETILDAVESLGLRCDGRMHALNSYENRVWLLGQDDGSSLVAKFYRGGRWSNEQIQEEHDFVWEMLGDELPVVAPLKMNDATLHHHAGFRFSVYPRQGGRAPELDQPEVLRWMGRLMARLHRVGARRPFDERETLDVESFGYDPRNWLLDEAIIPPELIDVWAGVADQALDLIESCYEQAGAVRMLRLHGDCHVGNVLWTPVDEVAGHGGPHFVDFDDARMGPAVQDLWMLLSGEADEMIGQLRYLLEGYDSMREFDRSELVLVEALRTLRLLHHSAWLARRWNDPAFPAAFPWFAMPRYWEERILELREQISRMEESALAA
jgi:Ser/Thr protein kinase RdoA (MazF antagonist)